MYVCVCMCVCIYIYIYIYIHISINVLDSFLQFQVEMVMLLFFYRGFGQGIAPS
jgi:hypothetical protein